MFVFLIFAKSPAIPSVIIWRPETSSCRLEPPGLLVMKQYLFCHTVNIRGFSPNMLIHCT